MREFHNGYGIDLINSDNFKILSSLVHTDFKCDLVYADMMYDDKDFERWIPHCRELLNDTGSIFIQTDYRSVTELKIYMDKLFGKDNFVNWIIWPYDWGGRPKDAFGRKHDDILFYSKTKNYKFFGESVSIPKATAETGLNESGRDWKIPTDVWGDIGNFHTMSNERISGVKWQKPERLVERIIRSVTEESDIVLDPFVGSGTTAAVCYRLRRECVGIEIDEDIYDKAVKRIENLMKADRAGDKAF